MLRKLSLTTTLALAAAPALADGHANTMGYALSPDGSSLTVMQSNAAPAEATTIMLATPVRSIAWRPVIFD